MYSLQVSKTQSSLNQNKAQPSTHKQSHLRTCHRLILEDVGPDTEAVREVLMSEFDMSEEQAQAALWSTNPVVGESHRLVGINAGKKCLINAGAKVKLEKRMKISDRAVDAPSTGYEEKQLEVDNRPEILKNTFSKLSREEIAQRVAQARARMARFRKEQGLVHRTKYNILGFVIDLQAPVTIKDALTVFLMTGLIFEIAILLTPF